MRATYEKGAAMPGKIVVGYDASDASTRALNFAVERAKAEGTGVIIAHVLEWSPYSFLTPEEIEERHKRRSEELKRAEEAVVAPAVKALADSGLQVETAMKFGHIADTLCRIANEEGASQIVVARTGETGLASRIFGSVAGSLIQSAPVPVTIVP